MTVASVRVHMEILDVEVGLWCNTCMLPSGVLVRFVTSTGTSMSLRQKLSCEDAEDHGPRHDVVPS